MDAGRGTTHLDYARSVANAIWVDGVPWRKQNYTLVPLSMPHVQLVVNRADLRRALWKHRCLVAYWTSDWDTAPSEWWWTCCKRPDYSLQAIESQRGRRTVRGGLKDCRVEVIAPGDFAELAYPIYRVSLEEYGWPIVPLQEYQATISRMAGYAGTEFWGAFVGERLAAFATCQVIDGAVTLGSTKSHPQFKQHNPNGAMFFTIARHYLARHLLYVSNGSRTLWHPTTINEYLERLGFEKVYARLNVERSPLCRTLNAVQIARWGGASGWRGWPRPDGASFRRSRNCWTSRERSNEIIGPSRAEGVL